MIKKILKGITCAVAAVMLLALGSNVSLADGGRMAYSASELERGQLVRLGEWFGEPLAWYVIDIQGDRVMLMLARDQVGRQPYNKEQEGNVTWETCTLRKWLNGEFYENAFGENEKKLIVESDVKAHRYPENQTDPGKDTRDRVFLLSVQEFEKLVDPFVEKIFELTMNTEGWWLRSLGSDQRYAKGFVRGGIRFGFSDRNFDNKFNIRPVLWINM